ncbi:MAG: hypothetical protein HQL64_15200 [Magnetococcales bacterium]|nr:hypothetical protein [Magnetococcales bacterium]
MKKAAYMGIPDLHNYDLKSSQVNGLIQQFQDAGIPIDWLVDYRDHPERREEYAYDINIDQNTFKICLLTLIMGGTLGSVEVKSRNARGAILTAIDDYHNGSSMSSSISYMKFKRIVRPLINDIDKWHNHLLTYNQNEQTDDVMYKYEGIVNRRNPTGKIMAIGRIAPDGTIQTLEQRQITKRRLAAFVLQGQEAAFIHHLTNLSSKYGFEVVGNEHDGLLTLGQIPKEAIEEAEKHSGLRNPILEEKPFG